jgi:hypothetical protein
MQMKLSSIKNSQIEHIEKLPDYPLNKIHDKPSFVPFYQNEKDKISPSITFRYLKSFFTKLKKTPAAIADRDLQKCSDLYFM